MPTTYAHWRFGCDCIETLPENLKKIVLANREIYDYGVHGPDIFFYDLTHPALPRYGSKLHHQPARKFFENCISVYNSNDNDKDLMMSYILGFLSHYVLDSFCHGYINKKAAVSGISHNKVEAEYDGHLITLDGRSIPMTDRAESLKPDRKNAEVMSRFFPFSAKELYRTNDWHHMIIYLLNCRSDFKRGLLWRLLKTFKLNNYADLILQKNGLPICKDSNLRIDKLKEYALEFYPELVDNMIKAIEGKEDLIYYFEHDFDPDGSEDIPVLSYEEELNYKPIINK